MLEWFVYYGDFNSREIRVHNVFNHGYFLERCKKAATTYREDREAFLEEIRSALMYCYWSKCEWEVVVSHWPQHASMKDLKIDVYDQVRLNWDVFSDYVWSHREELRKWKRK